MINMNNDKQADMNTAEPVVYKSGLAFSAAKHFIPGGVNSPVRAGSAVGVDPVFIASGQGSRIFDIDGNSYIDYVGSWGPLICGHAHPDVVAAVCKAAEAGLSFGAPTEGETRLAQTVIKSYPGLEMLRLVNSGTEACMSALRLARAATGRDYIVKFEGNYHGHFDGLLVKAGSGALTFGCPSSLGVPAAFAEKTLVANYNDAQSVADLFEQYKDQIAAVIVEPVAGNMGVVPAKSTFLMDLRMLTLSNGSLLIFDEVMSGFRVAWGGAASLYGICPDLVCFGKIIGGGLPLAAFGGTKRDMQHLAPAGPVYQAGTLSGNPLAVAAGLATLKLLQQPGAYDTLFARSAALAKGLADIAQANNIALTVNQVGAMLSVFFTEEEVQDYRSACTSDVSRFARFYRGMRNEGIYLAASQFEALFVSTAHSELDIDSTLERAEKVMRSLDD